MAVPLNVQFLSDLTDPYRVRAPTHYSYTLNNHIWNVSEMGDER